MADALRVSVLLKGKEILSRTFAKDRIFIGRDADCDVRLNSTEVSRRHACIQRREECGYLLSDLGSSNGIFVAEQRVTLSPIRDGGHARIGKFDLSFHLLDVPWEREEELETPRADVSLQATLQDGDAPSPWPEAHTPGLEATTKTRLRSILAALRATASRRKQAATARAQPRSE